jgi:rhomboid family GlyGly-CTERM serine protease
MNPRLRLLVPFTVWLGLFLVCLGLYLVDASLLLRYDRNLITQGEIWRLVTGHLLHLNWPHFWLNMGGVLIVAVFFRQDCSARQWLALILLSCLVISAGLFLFDPKMVWYMGLSGVLHSLFVVGAWYERRRFALSGNVLLVLLAAKLVYEQIGGGLAASETLIGAHVAVDAHLFGALAGVMFIVFRSLPWRRLIQGATQCH